MKWEEIVKIQYNAMINSSVFYLLTLSAIATFLRWLSVSSDFKINPAFGISLIFAFLFVLLQNFGVLHLINTQRRASYAEERNQANLISLNDKENTARKIALVFSGLATFSIWLTIALVLLPIMISQL